MRIRLRRSAYVVEPRGRWNPVGAEFFQGAEVFAGEQAAVLAEFGGGGGVEEAGGIGGAHLEGDAHLELAEGHAVEEPADVVVRIAPEERVDAPGRAVAEDFGPLAVGAGRLVAIHGKAEIIFAAAEVGEAAAVEDDEVHGRSLLLACSLTTG